MERTVYIVDDDEAVRDSLRALLESNGFSVSDFSSASAFLSTADRNNKSCCLLLDVNMPEMDGIALLEAMNARDDKLPVIMMTGRGDLTLPERIKQAGAIAYLLKPIAYSDLVAALNQAFT